MLHTVLRRLAKSTPSTTSANEETEPQYEELRPVPTLPSKPWVWQIGTSDTDTRKYLKNLKDATTTVTTQWK